MSVPTDLNDARTSVHQCGIDTQQDYSFSLTQVVAEVGVLLEFRVVEALAAVEDPRPARLRREAAQRAHDRVPHPLPLPAGDALGDRLVADVLRRGEDNDGRVVRRGDVADRNLLLPDVGEKVRVAGIVDGVDDAVAAAAAAAAGRAAVATARCGGGGRVAVGRRRRRIAVGVGEAQLWRRVRSSI